MKQSRKTSIHYGRMHQAIKAYIHDQVSRKRLLNFLKWQMAMAEDWEVAEFLSEVQGMQNVDGDLIDEVTRTYTENVQHWVFLEEQDLSKELPNAIECTFPELIESVDCAKGGLRHALSMMVGVKTRLNLRGSYAALERALRLVNEELALLEPACEHVGSGSLLAPTFQSEKGEYEPLWCSAEGAPLSPTQINGLASHGHETPELSVSYADGISAHAAPPQLVTERIRVREQQQIRVKDYRRLEELFRQGMARTCPRCRSLSGDLCRSASGKETTMHKGRYRVGRESVQKSR